jgi:hypothetical protein
MSELKIDSSDTKNNVKKIKLYIYNNYFHYFNYLISLEK